MNIILYSTLMLFHGAAMVSPRSNRFPPRLAVEPAPVSGVRRKVKAMLLEAWLILRYTSAVQIYLCIYNIKKKTWLAFEYIHVYNPLSNLGPIFLALVHRC